MSNYDEENIHGEEKYPFEENILLEKAMTKELPHAVRIWVVPGSHIPHEDIPQNATIHDTFVFNAESDLYQVGLRWNIPDDLEGHMDTLADFSTLEELKHDFPHLFELSGDLLPFG